MRLRPEKESLKLLGVTRSKAKMFEYGVPFEHHIEIKQDPAKLFTISIGLLGNLAATINRDEHDADVLSELQTNLLFSAHFFDSYIQSKLNESLDPYVMLLGSAAYYLCDLPGSSTVLAKHMGDDLPDLNGQGLERLLLWLLRADSNTYYHDNKGPFSKFIVGISKGITQFFEDGSGEDDLLDMASSLRKVVYKFGTPRQLLFGDVVSAVLRKKLENSAWKALPRYSELPRDKWLQALKKESFIKELWPAQHRLGSEGVLKGKSAIVQMPTSAGKTKATELILRSAFLANRASLAIVIAPFRALCHEIRDDLVEAFRGEPVRIDELSDALQTDFEIAELLDRQQILVVTPEKLLYILRHTPELASHVGLLVFDEGHQFDNGVRGITYELLLTSLRSMIPEGVQKVLISAVISNAGAVGEWLNGEPNVVEGTALVPTFKSLGFASWLDRLGRIEYVNSRDAEQNEYFVPRVLERLNLGRKGRERKDRLFPEKSDGKAIALYLGMKLVPNGGIAIFCGRKSTAEKICKKAVDVIERGIPLTLPLEFSNRQEVERLTYLHIKNLGDEATATQSAAYGIFSHHGNTPHGIRLAVEHAMRKDLVRFVVCTSTLAQGVNLPIRYLIVTSEYQGIERIKVRDFHNLIGRAGRAGMHTEGSILFADPDIYDKRMVREGKRRWEQVKKLLDPRNSEPCISNLLSIFEPIKSDNGRDHIEMEALDLVRAYVRGPDEVANFAAEIYEEKGFSRNGVERQIAWKASLISAVENYLLSHWDDTSNSLSAANARRLAEGTLAFFLADEQQKEIISDIFEILSHNIAENVTDPIRRKIYGRTLYGLRDAQTIDRWIQENVINLLSISDETDILDLVWPLLAKLVSGGLFARFNKPEVLEEIAHGWIGGKTFGDLMKIIREHEAMMMWGTQRRQFKIDHVVGLCEGTLAYDGALLISALSEFIEVLDLDGAVDAKNRLQLLQKRLKYGLPTGTTIALYELGFSDRVISQDLAQSLGIKGIRKSDILDELKRDPHTARAVLAKYPAYYVQRLEEILA